MPDIATPKKKDEYLRHYDRIIITLGLGLILVIGLDLSLQALLAQRHQPKPIPADRLIMAPDHPRHLVDFSLVDQSGHKVTRKDFEHKIIVVNFIFTSCTVVCPYINAHISQIQKLTANDSGVKFLSLALDPVDDTVAVLAKYCQKYGEDPSHPARWLFVTGEESMMRNLVGTSFLSQDTSGDFAYMPGNFANSQRIVLVDPSGTIVKYFDGLNQGVVNAVVQEITALRQASP